MKEENFPPTRKPLHWHRQGVAGGELWSHGGEHSNKGAEGKVEKFPHKGWVSTSTHQPERFVCSPAWASGGWELNLRFRRSDPRERTGVVCVNTAWRGLMHHSWLRGSLGQSLDLPKRQETIVLGCGVRRGDSEHCLNELQRWAWATAISTNTRDWHKMLRLPLQPPRSLCASTGHYPHLSSQEPVQPATARVPWSRDNFPRRTHGMSGWCNVTQASATAGSPCIHTPPSPWPEWTRAPTQLLL